jgi:hypothetical protein
MLALTLFTAGQRFVKVCARPRPQVQPLAARWRSR